MPDKQVLFTVRFGDAETAPPTLFSNHVGVSRAGTEVQFEFVALDLNQIATLLAAHGAESEEVQPVEIRGKTVAKVVVPLHVFIQLKPHLINMFDQIERELNMAGKEENESERVSNV